MDNLEQKLKDSLNKPPTKPSLQRLDPFMGHVVLGHNRRSQPIALDVDKFVRHSAIMGTTGSGKTALMLNTIEHMIDQKIPTILVDVKGDMCNIALRDDPNWFNNVNFRVLTPGGTHGEQIDLFSNLQKPERVTNAVTQLLKMVGEKNRNPLSSKHHVFLSSILEYLHSENEKADLVTLAHAVLDPPFSTIGALTLEDFYPAKARGMLASKLNTMLASPSFKQWRDGVDLNVEDLLTERTDGKVNVTVYQISHLDEEQQIFAMALLFDSLVGWMRKQSGTDRLRAGLFVDECSGVLPPYPRNPATKKPIMTMLKQARAYGLGLFLASQNPMDLDYKALSNCETWIIGRLQMANDRKRVLEAVSSVTPHDRNQLEIRIGRLQSRDFVLCRPQSTADFRSKDIKCNPAGPMTSSEVQELMTKLDKYATSSS